MAVIALINGITTLNAVDISQYVTSVELDIEVDELETTNYASGGAKARIGGLFDSTVKLSLNDDFAASAIDSQLFALLGTVVAFRCKATNAANSATNPEYQLTVLVSKLPKLGKVGDLATMDVTWPASSKPIRAIV
jgi:hypothetical protein